VIARAQAAGVAGEPLEHLELMTSEVVTNAVRHAGGTSHVTVGVSVSRGRLVVEVADGDHRAPHVPAGRAGLPGGHGMRIVEALSHAWGWRADGAGGKVVWFSLAD
jgi:anti-sigma regulatory factor (Ser/Thr protein kinase)